MRAAKAQASLRIRAVSPEPPLLAHTSSESRGNLGQKARSLAPLNGLACAVKFVMTECSKTQILLTWLIYFPLQCLYRNVTSTLTLKISALRIIAMTKPYTLLVLKFPSQNSHCSYALDLPTRVCRLCPAMALYRVPAVILTEKPPFAT